MDEHAPEHRPPEDPDSAPQQHEQDPPSPMSQFWHHWLKPILLVIIVLSVFRSVVVDWHDVPSGSMLPTIQEGDRIVVNKLAYDLRVPFTDWTITRWSSPSRGEVVTFWDPEHGKRMVKRVVAVGGDELELHNGQLLVNGQRSAYQPVTQDDPDDPLDAHRRVLQETLDEHDYTIQLKNHQPRGRSYGPVTVPEDHYFMLGDNRDNSGDSRAFGQVHEDAVIGRAFAVAISFENGILNPAWDRWFTGIR